MTSLGIVPGINFFVSGHFLILFIDLTNLPEALCVQKICRGIIHFDPTKMPIISTKIDCTVKRNDQKSEEDFVRNSISHGNKGKFDISFNI